jgi:outer membrane protein assembly factor BamB
VDGTVFVPGRGAFLALDADDGSERWRHEFGAFSTGVVGAPAVADDRVYAVVGEGTVVAFDRATGDTEWTHTPTQDVTTAPVAVGGSLFVAGQGESALIAFDAETGDVRWRRDLAGQEVHASPVVAGGTVVAASTTPGGCFLVGDDDCTSSGARGGVEAFDVESGERRWRFASERGESGVGGTPASDGQRVFVPLGTGLAAVELDTGERRWRRELDTEFTRSAPALAGGRLVVSGNDGRILSLGG